MFERLAPYIFCDHSFLRDSSASTLKAEVDGWEDWSEAHAGRYKDDRLIDSLKIKTLRDVLVNRRAFSLENEALLRIDHAVDHGNDLFGIQGISPSRYVVSKYTTGCHIKPHSDTDFFNTSRVYTGVYYLNQNYEGGEIFFPKFGVSIKPASGSLLLFLSEYLHGVQPIIEGTRFSIVWFGLSQSMMSSSRAD